MSTTAATTVVIDPAHMVSLRERSPRQGLVGAGTLTAEEGIFAGRQHEVWVFNLSLTGIGFRSDQPAPIATLHRIHLHTSTLQLNTRVRIVRCDKKSVGYDIGAEFVE